MVRSVGGVVAQSCVSFVAERGRVRIEVGAALFVVVDELELGAFALKWGQAIAGDLVSQLLLALGGGTGVAAVVAKGVQVYRTLGKLRTEGQELRTAVGDAVAFGNDMADAETNKQAAAVVTAHKKRQSRNGTRKVIQAAGAAVSAPPDPLPT